MASTLLCAKVDLEFLVPLSYYPEYWDYRHILYCHTWFSQCWGMEPNSPASHVFYQWSHSPNHTCICFYLNILFKYFHKHVLRDQNSNITWVFQFLWVSFRVSAQYKAQGSPAVLEECSECLLGMFFLISEPWRITKIMFSINAKIISMVQSWTGWLCTYATINLLLEF